jgi:hypothetical protein
MSSTGLGREDIRALLDDLSAELAARGARAELFLVGGAALAVAYDATRATRDLDAVFVPTDVVRQAARAVAEHRGLAEDWLNPYAATIIGVSRAKGGNSNNRAQANPSRTQLHHHPHRLPGLAAAAPPVTA